MGATLSKEKAFIKDLKKELDERKIKVKRKNLIKFFICLHDICPWFVVTRPQIVTNTWKQIGDEIMQYYSKHGKEKDKQVMYFYWTILGETVTGAELDPLRRCPVNREIVKKAEASHSQSRASSTPPKIEPNRSGAF